MASSTQRNDAWPELAYESWADTLATLHLWTQIVGKVRLVQTPWTNHSWHAPLYVTSRGLWTSAIAHGRRTFDMEFDFVDHALVIRTSDGGRHDLELRPRTVADFYGDVMATLDRLVVPVRIHTTPNEIPDAIPFDEDEIHASYDADRVNAFWRALVQVDRVFKVFRARFIGKCSPVHFFWGSFDHAVTRFSGRTAPLHPAGIPNMPDWVAREAYSHEVSSAGFWPGGAMYPEPIFYSYAYPKPDGFSASDVAPAEAAWLDGLGEFALPYEAVRSSVDPDATLLAFLESTYGAAAAASWDVAALELGDPRARFSAASPA